MNNDIVMYERVYRALKMKIECGLLPAGSRLPSRANLCREFDTSEKTVRRAVKMLEQEGFVETEQRKRPTVAFDRTVGNQSAEDFLHTVDSAAANDVLKTGILLCLPVVRQGMALCQEETWTLPEAVVEKMDPQKPTEFWRLSNRFWRYFVARNGNDLILRVMDSLGFAELDPLPGTPKIRTEYREKLRALIRIMKRGGEADQLNFDDLFSLYGFSSDHPEKKPVYRVPSSSILLSGIEELEQRLRKAQERYSTVCMDILGLIVIGRYRPGDRLPSHEELRGIYSVSIDTTVKAIQRLQEWGVVTGTRGKGIFVAMDLEAMKQISISPELLAGHVRRFIDSLELLSLTVEGVTSHAASRATEAEAERLREEIMGLEQGDYLHQLAPVVLLSFIEEHIEYHALRAIYGLLQKDFRIGRNIPRLVTWTRTQLSGQIYNLCADAVRLLAEGDSQGFSKKTTEMFHSVNRIIVSELKQLGYWDAAMDVYDGSTLWK